MKHVVILGSGRIGTALAELIKDNAQVDIWDVDISKTPDRRPFEDIIPQADAVIMGIPSQAIRHACADMQPLLKPDCLLVVLSKGVEADSLKTMDEVMTDALPHQPFALLSGPMLAEELVKRMGGAAVVATKKAKDFEMLKSLFEGEALHLEHSTDLHGVALAGVLKNVFAIGLGIAEGVGWGENMKGWLTAESAREMQVIIRLLGGDPATMLTQAGLGDMVATGFSPHSSNHKYGKALAETGSCDHKSEGCISLPSLAKLLEGRSETLPIYEALEAVVVYNKNASETFKRFLV